VDVVLVNVGGFDAKRCRIPQEKEEKAWQEEKVTIS